MAVLTCALCEEVAEPPIVNDGKVFCCHGCLQLYDILGEDEIELLKSRPGLNWAALRQQKVPLQTVANTETEMCTLQLDGLWCASCGVLVETVLKRAGGVVSAQIDFVGSTADVAFDSRSIDVSEITRMVEELGYGVREAEDSVSVADRQLLRRFTAAAILSLLSMMISLPVWFGYFSGFSSFVRWVIGGLLWALATPVVFWAGGSFLRGALSSIRHRVPTMDLLISLGSVSAYVYSFVSMAQGGSYLYFDTSSLLITFLLLSRSMEMGTRKRASRAVEMLSRSSAKTALKVTANGDEESPISHLGIGDYIRVRDGETVPVDGRIISGMAAFEESILSGESLPVSKTTDDVVYAGSVSLDGHVVVEVTRVGDDTVLGQTTTAIRAAQQLQSNRQKLIQKVLNVFVPVVLATGLLTFVTSLELLHLSLGASILRAIAVWVIACPCSLSVAVPILSAGTITRFSQNGMLLRDPDCLERIRNVDTVVFDKTGTLTRGEFRLVQMFPNDNSMLSKVASVQLSSSHPVGKAVVRAARLKNLPVKRADDYESHVGSGVSGRVFGDDIRVEGWTRRSSLPEVFQHYAEQWNLAGLTISVVRINGVIRGVMGFTEELRSSSSDVISELRASGKQLIMLTGDNEGAAARVAKELGIDQWESGQQPTDKSQLIADLQSKGSTVAFVGDGANDAAALTQADLGIALRSGADLAIQSGHLVMTGSNLTSVVEALQVGQLAASLLRLNLSWAVIYNIGGIILAVLGVASPAIAALAMLLSSSFVLGNSLRVLGWSLEWYAKRFAFIAGGVACVAVAAWFGM